MADEVKKELQELDMVIKNKIGHMTQDDMPDYLGQEYLEDQAEEAKYDPLFDESAAFDPVPEADDDFEPEVIQLQLHLGDDLVLGTVITRKRDAHGNPIGKSADNPIFDTRVYQVQFPDHRIEEYSANIIAENLYAQVKKIINILL